MYATLGPEIEFEVLVSPNKFESKREYTYAKHDLVEDRPRLQWIARDLEEIELAMHFHVSFTNPQAQIDALLKAAEDHKALALVFGNGRHRGFFVVRSIEESILQQADDGSVVDATITVKLQEYAAATRTELLTDTTDAPIAVSPSLVDQEGASLLGLAELSLGPLEADVDEAVLELMIAEAVTESVLALIVARVLLIIMNPDALNFSIATAAENFIATIPLPFALRAPLNIASSVFPMRLPEIF
jgi:phage protein U